jgi:hypothetical protein
MDPRSFDQITRSLATGTSRRSVMRGLAGGVLAAVGLNRAGTSLARGEKVGVCHGTGSATNPWQYIDVSAKSYPAHQAHGDGLINSTSHCGECGNVCEVKVPKYATASCNDGKCGYICNEGYKEDDHFGCTPIEPVCKPGYVDDGAGGCKPIQCKPNYELDAEFNCVCQKGFVDDGDGNCIPPQEEPTYSCYWLSSNGLIWGTSLEGNDATSFEECKAIDSCSQDADGDLCGGGLSGGCYKWATSPADPGIPFCPA